MRPPTSSVLRNRSNRACTRNSRSPRWWTAVSPPIAKRSPCENLRSSLKPSLQFIYYLGVHIGGGLSRAQVAGSESAAAMSKPEPNTIFVTAEAVHEAEPAMPHATAESDTHSQLSPSAAAFADNPQEAAFSPIVLAGLVRVIEVCLVAAVGFAVYVCYVVPTYGFAWY